MPKVGDFQSVNRKLLSLRKRIFLESLLAKITESFTVPDVKSDKIAVSLVFVLKHKIPVLGTMSFLINGKFCLNNGNNSSLWTTAIESQ